MRNRKLRNVWQGRLNPIKRLHDVPATGGLTQDSSKAIFLNLTKCPKTTLER